MRRVGGAVRPESGAACAAQFYDKSTLAQAYTAAGTATQRELAQRCLLLLGEVPRHAVLADLGAGSGLSGAVLAEAGHAWLGLDVSRRMLAAALDGVSSARGALALSDLGDGLPLRRGCLDGAVSVSALQWLATADKGKDADARCGALFDALAAALRPGAPAALQVYPGSDDEAAALVRAAARAGFPRPLLCVDFPHSSAAKKLFLCVRKGGADGMHVAASNLAPEPAPACALAWPRRAAFAHAWWQRDDDSSGARADALARLDEEHARYLHRLVRLLRRGVVVADGAGDIENQAASIEAATRAAAACLPLAHSVEEAGQPHLCWCCRGRVACVSAPPAAAAAAEAAAAVLRDAGWSADVRLVDDASGARPVSDARDTAPSRLAGALKRPMICADDNAGAETTANGMPQPASRRARVAASRLRRDCLRAASGAPRDVHFVSLLPLHAGGIGVRAGILLSPDAAPHGAASLQLTSLSPRSDAAIGAAAAAATLTAVAALKTSTHVALCAGGVTALELIAPACDAANPQWRVSLLAGGPWDAATAATAAAALLNSRPTLGEAGAVCRQP